MAAVDSTDVFMARLEELGLESIKQKFKDLGWTSFGDFAFATTGFKEPEPEVFAKEVLVPLLGDAAHSLAPRVRRLFMQAYAVTQQDLQRFTEPSTAPKPTLHPEDKRVALVRVREKFKSAFPIEGVSEPSDRLINLCFSILTSDAVRYVSWEKSTSRLDETRDPKFDEDPGLKLQADGTFTPARNAGPQADLASELKWDLALHRRAIAKDFAGLMRYEAAKFWHEK